MRDAADFSLDSGLLAVAADVATSSAARCSICTHPIVRGDRIALALATERTAHVSCIAMAADRTPA